MAEIERADVAGREQLISHELGGSREGYLGVHHKYLVSAA